MVTKNELFMQDPANRAVAAATLERMARHADGERVLYATDFARPDGRLRGSSAGAVARWAFDHTLEAASKALASGLPQDGWLLVTDAGVQVHTRRLIGDHIGPRKGTIPHELLASISIDHGKKIGHNRIQLTFVDGSEATLLTKTRSTYPALEAWTGLFTSGGAPEFGDGPIFDPTLLEVQGH